MKLPPPGRELDYKQKDISIHHGHLRTVSFLELAAPKQVLEIPVELYAVVTANVPAVRAALDCIYTSTVNDIAFEHVERQYGIPISSVPICWGGDGIFGYEMRHVVLGLGQSLPISLQDTSYVWSKCNGQAVDIGHGSTSFAAVLTRKEILENVRLATTLFGPDVEIRPSQSSVPDQRSATLNSLEVNATDIYSLLAADVATLEQFPLRFFESLVISCYGIPWEWLANGIRKDDVIAAVKCRHCIIRAQTISGGAGVRRRFDETATDPSFVQQDPPLRSSEINVGIRYGSRRVIQNPMPTYVLVALLSAILVLNIFVIWSSERSGYRYAVPEAPGSIAVAASLLADSTIPRSMREECQWMTEKKLGVHLDKTKFRLGWFKGPPDHAPSRGYTTDIVEELE
ncbi:hypothetical protein DL769_010277 [Monosporascus sp. CRB-8-3]|nr:hypothetical protein DL769_010277 [Monosporascus sp. CRB-8-3]